MLQLFSNEGLAARMAEQLKLLHVMVISLKYMMSKILIQNTLHGKIYDIFLTNLVIYVKAITIIFYYLQILTKIFIMLLTVDVKL